MNTSEKFLYLIAGTGIGAALGILFAPKSGEEIRSTLSTRAHHGMDLLNEKVEQGKKYVREKGGASGTVRSIVDSGKQRSPNPSRTSRIGSANRLRPASKSTRASAISREARCYRKGRRWIKTF